MIPVKIPWTTAPPAGTPLRTEGLARGLRIFIRTDPKAGGLRDELTGLFVAHPSGKSVRSDSQHGAVTYNDGTAGSMAFDHNVLNNDWTDEVTVGAIFKYDTDTGGASSIISCSGGGNDFLLNFGRAGNNTALTRIGTGGTNDAQQGARPPDWTQWASIVTWRVNGLGARLFNQRGSTGLDSSATGAPNNMAHDFLVFPNTVATTFACATVWNRELTHAEIKSFHANPWQMFEPRTVWLPLTEADATTPGLFPMRKPWTTKPPEGTKLDWSNPLCKGLQLVDGGHPTSGPRDLTGKYPANAGNDVIARSQSRAGEGIFFDFSRNGEADAQNRAYDVGTDLSVIPAITVASSYRLRSPASTNGSYFLVSKERSGFTAWLLELTDNNAAARKPVWRIHQGSSQSIGTGGSAIYSTTDTDPHLLLGRYESGNIYDVWYDGALVEAAGSPPSGNITSRDHSVVMLGATLGGTTVYDAPYDVDHYLACVWDRALSEAEVKSFSANPWQVFEPQTLWLPYEVAGAASSVIITDVNTTESWVDGDTGLIITGTGFR